MKGVQLSSNQEERIPLQTLEIEAECGEQTTAMTVISMMKCSIGTGVLAIPYVFAGGGIGLMSLTLAVLAAWNIFSSLRLISTEKLLTVEESRKYKQSTESPLAALSRVAIGRHGASLVEFVFFVLVFGVVTSYLKACHDTAAPVILALTGTAAQDDVFLYAVLSLPLSLVRDVGRLAPVQTLGLGAIFICLAMVLFYTANAATSKIMTHAQAIAWLGPPPSSADGALRAWAQGFGVLSFCFGVVPIVPQFERSMRHRIDFNKAVYGSFFLTFALYAILGTVVVYLDPSPPGNVLYELPAASAALAARAAMALVCIASAPLPVVAGVEIILKRFATSFGDGHHRKLAVLGLIARSFLYFGAAFVAARVPSFAQIVSVVGAAAVSFLSFVLPPLIHGLLLFRSKTSTLPIAKTQLPRISTITTSERPRTVTLIIRSSSLAADVFATVSGMLAVVFVTYLVSAQVVQELRRSTQP